MIQDLHEAPPDEALKEMREFLQDEKRFCKITSARDIDGNPVNSHSKKARSWCIEGLYYMLGLSHNMVVKYLHEAAESLFNKNLIWVNDSLGHAAILQVIDEAIEMAEGDSIEMMGMHGIG